MSDIERIISNVNATMSMEGMPLTENDKIRIAECIEGKKSFDAAVREIVEHYRKAI